MAYLIDGHNLIPKLGLRLDAPDDEIELVRLLQEASRLSRRHIEVYFDGAPAGNTGTRRFGSVTARFISERTTADAAIKARLDALGRAARGWTVVSSDREIQAAARAARATTISSEDFAHRLRTLKAPGWWAGKLSKTPIPQTPSEPDVAEWMELFRSRK
jgi:predicted RNA-binding protein with PIN domain